MSYKRITPMPVTEGGSGASTFTSHGVLLGNTTSAFGVTAAGTTGQVLTGVTGSAPTFQAPAAASITLTGDSGSASGSNITVKTGQSTKAAGSTVLFSGSGSTLTLVVTDTNNNTLFGASTGSSTPGTNNTGIGAASLGALNGGAKNCGMGEGTLNSLVSGDFNTAVGYFAASGYTGSEGSNITIGCQVLGTAGENNVLRIGNGTGTGTGQLANTYISGIAGVSVGSVASVLTNSGDHLGTATITAGTGITVTPTANVITIANSGVTQINGDTGTAIPVAGVIGIIGADAGGTISFTTSANDLYLNMNDSNDNICIGSGNGTSLSGGTTNVGIGDNTFSNITTGNYNSALGGSALTNLVNGENNVCLGYNAGLSYGSNESNNIAIGGNQLGAASETGVTRIGVPGFTTSCYIQGIDGVDLSSSVNVVTESGDQLGTATITAGSGITVTGGPNTITIAATGGGGGNSSLYTSPNVQLTSTSGSFYAIPGSTGASASPLSYYFPAAGTVSKLYVNVSTNTSTTNTTLTLYHNGVATSLVATMTALTTGVFTDLTHSVSVSAGDTMYWVGSTSTVGIVDGQVSMNFNG